MNKREIKEDCFLDMLKDELNSVEAVLIQIDRIKEKEGLFEESIIQKDLIRAYFDLELALASLCIILRKMNENMFIDINDGLRKDINSIIHSNRFEYYNHNVIYAYSKKGKELVALDKLLSFAYSLL